MKSERKSAIQKAKRFFYVNSEDVGGGWVCPDYVFHGWALVEEVCRLRRELKKVNKVNERYSRALGFRARNTPARTIKEIEARLRQAEDSAEHWKSVSAEKSREAARLQAQLEKCKENCEKSEKDLEISRKRVEDLEMRLEDAEFQLKATTDNVREFEKESGVWTEQRNFWTLCARVQALIRNNETLYKELQEANARALRWEEIAADEKKKRREIEKEAKEFARMIIKEST